MVWFAANPWYWLSKHMNIDRVIYVEYSSMMWWNFRWNILCPFRREHKLMHIDCGGQAKPTSVPYLLPYIQEIEDVYLVLSNFICSDTNTTKVLKAENIAMWRMGCDHWECGRVLYRRCKIFERTAVSVPSPRGHHLVIIRKISCIVMGNVLIYLNIN